MFSSLLVFNIPALVCESDLIIHFMAQKNGGCGDVVDVKVIGSNANGKVAKILLNNALRHLALSSIIEKEHILGGTRLTVTEGTELLGWTQTTMSKAAFDKVAAKMPQLSLSYFQEYLCPAGVIVTDFNENSSEWTIEGAFDRIVDLKSNLELIICDRFENVRKTDTATSDNSGNSFREICQNEPTAAFTSPEASVLGPESLLNTSIASARDYGSASPALLSTDDGYTVDSRVRLIVMEPCNIASVHVDAIVCSSGINLSVSGAAKAIWEAAGKDILQKECDQIKKRRSRSPLLMGEVVETMAYRLPAKYIFHVMTPKPVDDTESEEESFCKMLVESYSNVFLKAEELKARSIATFCLGCCETGCNDKALRLSVKALLLALMGFCRRTSRISSVVSQIRIVGTTPDLINNVKLHLKRLTDTPSFKPRISALVKSGVGSADTNGVSKKFLFTRGGDLTDDGFATNGTIFQESCTDSKRQFDFLKTKLDTSAASSKIGSAEEHYGEFGNAENNGVAEANTTATTCGICMEEIGYLDTKELQKCCHKFHTTCIDNWFKTEPSCPICNTLYGVALGNQPVGGKMIVVLRQGGVPGFDCNNFYEITYEIPSGKQTIGHPNPGLVYGGIYRVAYLPQTPRATMILKMLQLAFRKRLTFTIGHSLTTGADGVLVWNNIHHKTSLTGGPERYGYPDEVYFDRVEAQLTAFGITKDLIH